MLAMKAGTAKTNIGKGVQILANSEMNEEDMPNILKNNCAYYARTIQDARLKF